MAKNEYFSHDYHARDHLRDVRKDFGLEGYGFYWCVVEILHENGGFIKETDVAAIAYDLRIDEAVARSILYDYKMFTVKGGKISNQRVTENIKKRKELSEKRKAAAEERWKPDEEEKPEIVITEDDACGKFEDEWEREEAKEFYADGVEKAFQRFLEKADLWTLEHHSCYDYKSLFDAIVQEVRNKDQITVNGQKVPTYYYLFTISRLIKDDTQNLDKAIRDVEERYAQGKIRNKLQYMISALYNAARLDTL